MIQELQDLLKVIQHLPDYVMWVLAGMLFYKLFIVGNIYALARFAITKLHDYLTREKIVKHQIQFKDIYMLASTEKNLYKLLLSVMRDSHQEPNLFAADIDKLNKAWENRLK